MVVTNLAGAVCFMLAKRPVRKPAPVPIEAD
jgi:hypothetical protein